MWCSKDECGLHSSAGVMGRGGCCGWWIDVGGALQVSEPQDWWLLLDGVLQELPLETLGSASPIDESHEGRFGERSRDGSYAGPMYCSCCC